MAHLRKPQVSNWEKDFLNAYRETGNFSRSAREAFVDRSTVAKKRRRDPIFAQQMQEAQAEALRAWQSRQ